MRLVFATELFLSVGGQSCYTVMGKRCKLNDGVACGSGSSDAPAGVNKLRLSGPLLIVASTHVVRMR
jgi:hypothetical protein